MPTISDIAICLRRWDFSETSQTVRLFGRTHGALRGLAKGAKRERGRFSGGFDALTRGQVVAIVKPGRELATLTEWHLQDTYRVVRHRLDANRVGLYMIDLVHHMLTDLDPHPELFDALAGGLDQIGAGADAAAVLLRFQWTLLRDTGYRPELDRDADTGKALPANQDALLFSAGAGGVVVEMAIRDCWRVRPATIDLLRGLERGDGTAAADPAVVDRANRLLAVYARAIVGRELPTLRWAFSDLAAR